MTRAVIIVRVLMEQRRSFPCCTRHVADPFDPCTGLNQVPQGNTTAPVDVQIHSGSLVNGPTMPHPEEFSPLLSAGIIACIVPPATPY